MKKRRVMRLLAVVMAASLAATSVPGTALTGTETVYAENLGDGVSAVSFNSITMTASEGDTFAAVPVSNAVQPGTDDVGVWFATEITGLAPGTAYKIYKKDSSGAITTKVESQSTGKVALNNAEVEIELSGSTFVYDGTAKNPTVTSVKIGNTTLTSADDYDVTYSNDVTNVSGVHYVTITAKAGSTKCTGTVNKTFAITAIETSTAPTLEVSADTLTDKSFGVTITNYDSKYTYEYAIVKSTESEPAVYTELKAATFTSATDLDPETGYTVYCRVKKTTNHEASAPVTTLPVTTKAENTVTKTTVYIHVESYTYFLGEPEPPYSYRASNYGNDTITLTNPDVNYTVKDKNGNAVENVSDFEVGETYSITATVTLTNAADIAAYEIDEYIIPGTLTVKKARTKIAISANSGSVTVGGSFTPVITVTKDEDGSALSSDLAEYKIYREEDYTRTPVALADALATAGTYSIEPDIKNEYIDTYQAWIYRGTLTVTDASTDNPEPDTEKKPSDTTTDTTTLTVKENTDGSKTVVDDKGNVIANEKVTTADGNSYVTDKDGKVVTDDKVTTEDGKTYITDADGVIETGKVTFEGNQYITGSDGAILTDQVAKTPSGNKVYVDEDGVIVKNQAVSSNGKKYYATKTGKIATNGFVKTAKGNTVYATKSGALQVNKAFKASNGKKYVADKNGKIVKGKKITIGNKTYTTNKKGVIIKVTTKKK